MRVFIEPCVYSRRQLQQMRKCPSMADRWRRPSSQQLHRDGISTYDKCLQLPQHPQDGVAALFYLRGQHIVRKTISQVELDLTLSPFMHRSVLSIGAQTCRWRPSRRARRPAARAACLTSSSTRPPTPTWASSSIRPPPGPARYGIALDPVRRAVAGGHVLQGPIAATTVRAAECGVWCGLMAGSI